MSAVSAAGYAVDSAFDGERADFLAQTEQYDAIILDLGLPKVDGLTILRGWREYVATAPDEVTSVVVTITFPANPELPEVVHDRPVAIVGGVYAGDPEEGLRVMAPLRELGTPLFDMSGPTPFTVVQNWTAGLGK